MKLEFTVGDHAYRVGPLSAIAQHHIGRKLAPALIPLANLRVGADQTPDDVAQARALCSLSSTIQVEDMDYVVQTLLGCVTRSHGSDRGWAKMTASNGSMMFNDFGIEELNVILLKTLDAHGIIDFFVDRRSGLADPQATGPNGSVSQTGPTST